MSRPPTVDDLWRVPHAYDPQLAPHGRTVAYVVRTPDRDRDDYVRRIWLVDVATAQTRALTAGPDDDSPRWSPDGRHLAFRSRRGGDLHPQLWLIRTDGGEPWQLATVIGGVAGGLAWSPGGDMLALLGAVRGSAAEGDPPPPVVVDRAPYKRDGTGFLRSGHGVAVFVVAVADGQIRQLTHDEGLAMPPAWSPDGSKLAYGCQHAADPWVAPAYLVDAAGGEPMQVTDDGLFHSHTLWAPDGAALVTVGAEARMAGPRRLYTVPAGGGTSRELLPGFELTIAIRRVGPGADAVPAFTPDGRLLFLACDRSRDHLYHVATGGGPRKLLGGEHRLVKGLSVTPGGLAYLEVTPATTGEVCVAGHDGTQPRRLTRVFAEALPDVSLPTPESRTFTAPDGVAVHGWLLRGAPGPAPLLLDIHGGPHDSWSPAFEGPELYQHVLAANGWQVLKLNMRGSDGYGTTFWRALVGNWGIADEGDYHAALDALVKDGTADPARLAVAGYSYGGFATCWLTARSDRFRAAVAGGMICNLISLCGTSDLGALAARLAVGVGAEDEQYLHHLGLLAQRSPLAQAHRVRTPTLIVQGEAEQRVPLEQAEQWFHALHAQGTPARLVVYPGGGHDMIDEGPPSHRLDLYRRWVQWLQEHTLGTSS